jgi:transcriptional repressor NrdR
MRCPFCRNRKNRVVDSRMSNDGMMIRRRRACSSCKRRFTTYERVEEAAPMVVKKDGRREPFDRAKIIGGLNSIETTMAEQGDREVASNAIGAAVMNELHKIDQVAYVRFASVYRSFKDIDEFMHELEDLINQRKQAPAARGEKKVDSSS